MSIISYYYKSYFYFSRLPRTAQYCVTTTCIALSVLFWWLLCYTPIRASVAYYNKNVTYLNKQKQKYVTYYTQDTQAHAINKQPLIQDVQIHHALAWVIDCARSHGLLIDSCKAQENYDKKEYTSASFVFSFRGSVASLLSFFKCLERSRYVVSCLSSTIKRIDDSFVHCTFELEFFTAP
ncbi:hypothetical protein H0X48_00645 [Candidatus Dependentiae bacterium]|nr:hypothetical protein [Candidatus Dependentiae bacterium]